MESETTGKAVPKQDRMREDGVWLAEQKAIWRLRGHDDALPPDGIDDLCGLALSGGGIRSAASCIGAMQALAAQSSFDRLDYVSSVSGGGYAATLVTTAILKGRAHVIQPGQVDFPLLLPEPKDFRDSEEMKTVRDHANFLVPGGLQDYVINIAIVLRGLVANALIVVPVLMLFAGLVALYALVIPWIGNGWPTMLAALGTLVVLARWAILSGRTRRDEISSGRRFTAILALAVFGAAAFIDLQPIALGWVNAVLCWFSQTRGPVAGWLGTAAIPAAIAAIPLISKLADVMAKVFATQSTNATWVALGKRALAHVGYWLVALLVPVMLWIACLCLAHWTLASQRWVPGWLSSNLSVVTGANAWLVAVSLLVAGGVLAAIRVWFAGDPNGNTLHRLYRHRLGRAFIWPSLDEDRGGTTAGSPGGPKVSDLATEKRPYPIFNAALNIAGSDKVNARGRNADFFMFTPKFTGSEATGYFPTNAVEAQNPDLNCATVLAVSGAAVSAYMGSVSMRVLAPTLALMNIRLGYWLNNPAADPKRAMAGRFPLVCEMFGLLDERSPLAYLTDGGHVENLGIYELLKRRCKLIVAIDAECDPGMEFASLVRMQRLARIDLGARIDLPWQTIGKAIDGNRSTPVHCAVGTIDYIDGATGYIVYFKAVMTGDENDYIKDYASRYKAFPHESTGDQFFSEEQFEVYRALMFHAVQGVLKGKASVAAPDGQIARLTSSATEGSVLAAVHAMLVGPVGPPPPSPQH